MPQPCTVSTTTVNLTANGAPAVLQADVRVAQTANKLRVVSDGLQVPDYEIRQHRATNTATFVAASFVPLGFETEDYRTISIPTTAFQIAATQFAPGSFLPGVWRITAGLVWDSTTTAGAEFLIVIRLNGATPIAGQNTYPPATGNAQNNASVEWLFGASDFFEVCAFHRDSVSRMVVADPRSFMSAHYVGAGA